MGSGASAPRLVERQSPWPFPSTSLSDRFKEATPADDSTAGTWLPARRSDAGPRGQWWQMFGNPKPDRLENEVTVSNQNLKPQEGDHQLRFDLS